MKHLRNSSTGNFSSDMKTWALDRARRPNNWPRFDPNPWLLLAPARGSPVMGRFVLGLALIFAVACSSVSAGQLQASSDNLRKLPSSSQKHPSKNNKQVSKVQMDGRSVSRSMPLSAAETYASERSVSSPASPTAKPMSPTTNSWTGFYVGAGIGAAEQ